MSNVISLSITSGNQPLSFSPIEIPLQAILPPPQDTDFEADGGKENWAWESLDDSIDDKESEVGQEQTEDPVQEDLESVIEKAENPWEKQSEISAFLSGFVEQSPPLIAQQGDQGQQSEQGQQGGGLGVPLIVQGDQQGDQGQQSDQGQQGGGLHVIQHDESNTQDETLPHIAEKGDQ